MIKYYIARPEVITAIQWTGSNTIDVLTFIGAKYRDVDRAKNQYFYIMNESGRLKVNVGDYVMKNSQKEYIALPPDEFESMYTNINYLE